MSVKSRFCKVLSEVQETEMLAFIDAVENKNYRRASESLESLFSMKELAVDMCPRV